MTHKTHANSNRKISLHWPDSILMFMTGAFFLVFTINSYLAQGGDFRVFYEAGFNFIRGLPIYDVLRDGQECYKYPPWVTPLFVPFSLFSLRFSGVLWRLLNLACMLYALRWTLTHSKSRNLILLSFLSFWGTWLFNLLQGQITPLLLALSLYGFQNLERNHHFRGWATLILGLTTKVFNGIALFGITPRPGASKALMQCLVVVIVASLPALLGYHESTFIQRTSALVHAYFETMTSPGGNLGGAGYGLSSTWKQLLIPLSLEPRWVDAISFGISLFLFALFLVLTSKRLKNQRDRFTIAIGLAASIHPLAFSYTFAWAFPLAAATVDRAAQASRNIRPYALWLAFFGLAGVIGLDRLPVLSVSGLPIRAISVWILAGTLVWTSSRSQ